MQQKKAFLISTLGIAVNLLLVGTKAAAAFMSGSVAVMLDAVNSLSSALMSVISAVAAKLSITKPGDAPAIDTEKLQKTVSLAIAAAILCAGIASLVGSVLLILHPRAANYTLASIIIIVTGLAVKMISGAVTAYLAKKLDSDALKGSGADTGLDSLSTALTLASAAAAIYAGVNLEGYVGLAISALIISAPVRIVLRYLKSAKEKALSAVGSTETK